MTQNTSPRTLTYDEADEASTKLAKASSRWFRRWRGYNGTAIGVDDGNWVVVIMVLRQSAIRPAGKLARKCIPGIPFRVDEMGEITAC